MYHAPETLRAVAQFGNVTGLLTQDTSKGTRAIASDFRYIHGLTRDLDGRRYKGRVLWDFGSGKELLSWMPRAQTVIAPFEKQTKDPYACAISPSGRYIAEGGDGVVRISTVE